MSHSPVCVKCNISMYMKKIGAYAIDMFAEPPRPYKIWNMDMWACPICDYEVLSGSGNSGMEYHKDKFDEFLELIKEEYTYVIVYEKNIHAMRANAVEVPLRSGMYVNIFQDPITCDEYEGRANLIQRIDKIDNDIDHERWYVNFGNGESNVERDVNLLYAGAK